jgi:hypothetical protein
MGEPHFGAQTGYEYRLGPTSHYLGGHAAVRGSLCGIPDEQTVGEYREWTGWRPLTLYRYLTYVGPTSSLLLEK